MDSIITAGILLNAAKIPLSVFRRLCGNYQPEELFTGESFWDELGMTPQQKQRLSDFLAKPSWAERELERTETLGARFITAKDIDYPARLLDLKNPPVGLYVLGNANLALPSASIVGTRHPSSYGQNTATQLARALAQQGVTVTSGGARGIDSAGHRGALQEDGITISVFGTGIDKVYPTENRDLFRRIAERGALVSEYPLGTGGEGWRFVERNRIIAALSSRVVIVESSETGGAMHTASMGLGLGREVWAVPGRISEETCSGSNRLLGEGAKVLWSIPEFVGSMSGNHRQIVLDFGEGQETQPPAPELSDSEKAVYSLLQRQGQRVLDDIVAESGLDDSDVQMALLTLEAEGLISTEAGRYSAV